MLDFYAQVVPHAAGGATYHQNVPSDVGAISIAHGAIAPNLLDLEQLLCE
jgi:hypothetical protein